MALILLYFYHIDFYFILPPINTQDKGAVLERKSFQIRQTWMLLIVINVVCKRTMASPQLLTDFRL